MVQRVTHLQKIYQTRRWRLVFMMILPAIIVLELHIFLPKRGRVLSPAFQTVHREGSLLSEGSASGDVGAESLFVSGGSPDYKYQSETIKNSHGGLIMLEIAREPKSFLSPERFQGIGNLTFTTSSVSDPVTSLEYRKYKVAHGNYVSKALPMPPGVSYVNEHLQEKFIHSEETVANITSRIYSSTNQVKKLAPKSRHASPESPVQSSSSASASHSAIPTDHIMRPRWSSASDQEMLDAKRQILNASTVKNDQELYAPAFWNISMFKRSYDLMEKTLKVYIYQEGLKPIFHQPILDGIYASEGWFMKLIKENENFVVNDPRKAHLFYMPFSSSTLRFSLYVPGPHGKRHLLQYLSNYVHDISAKHPFWNRTGGADHFLVACHDWAPYFTQRGMGHSIRVLCNSDLSEGFKLGKDISLPQANVLTAQNPLEDLGGRPPKRRRFLAFFAGRMHGYLRPILLKHWENKDPDMKILGKLSCGLKCRVRYAQYMKNSKYCICPRGYQVYSPRVVEAILHECVPVIISDNYVPPFFDVLNWEAFSVLVAEKEIPMLKDILLSIPRKKYISLQLGVRYVRRHFLWHTKPVKYDLFHMILHSVWLSRLNQMRVS